MPTTCHHFSFNQDFVRSVFVVDDACGDHSACESYNPNMCNQVWMKRHCKKMCGLCTPPEEEAPMSTSSLKETSAPKRKTSAMFFYVSYKLSMHSRVRYVEIDSALAFS